LLKQHIEKADPRRDLTTAEIKRFAKLEAIADKLKRGENVQSSVEVAHYLHTKCWQLVNYLY